MTSGRARRRRSRRQPSPTRSVAFLIPTLSRSYWNSLLTETTRRHSGTTVFTAKWPGHRGAGPPPFHVEVVGSVKQVELGTSAEGYAPIFLRVPVLALAGRLVRSRPRIIFTSMFSMWSMLAVLLKPFLRARVVVLWEGSTPGVDARQSRARIAWRRFIARCCDGIVTNTYAGRDYVTEHLRVPGDRVRRELYYVWPAPELMDVQRTGDSDRPLRFITVGHLTARKGVEYLLRAVAMLRDRSDGRFELSVLGTGPELDNLKRLAERSGLDDVVEWHGHVQHGALGDELASADVFVFPTLEDTLGVAPLEAMTAGMPVICSRHAGVAEFVPDDVGLIVDPRDAEALAAGLAWFVDHRDRIPAMGERAREVVAAHTPERAVTALEEAAARRAR